MRILVSNDDGIDAPGLGLLAEAALAVGSDVWIVAPERKWTAASHQLSFDRDLTLTLIGERTFACSGTPADCVVAAMTILFAGNAKPDLVLAGLNDKRNVAEDIAYSGTMAIAREGAFWGIPAIGVSKTDGVRDRLSELSALQRFLQVLWDNRRDWAGDGHWLSVNMPALLPAPLWQARLGRDKIANASDVLERTPERITYRIRRGRPGSSVPDDENALIDKGCATIVRHRWFADAAIPETVVLAWNDAMARASKS